MYQYIIFFIILYDLCTPHVNSFIFTRSVVLFSNLALKGCTYRVTIMTCWERVKRVLCENIEIDIKRVILLFPSKVKYCTYSDRLYYYYLIKFFVESDVINIIQSCSTRVYENNKSENMFFELYTS